MMADRSLTPADAAVATRSFARRFRGVFARPDDGDERDEIDPASTEVAREHLAAATALIEALPSHGETSGGGPAPIPTLLGRLEQAAPAAAARIEAVPADGWGDDLEALQDAIAAIAAHLRAAADAVRT